MLIDKKYKVSTKYEVVGCHNLDDLMWNNSYMR